ncbi:Rne/Rng family ribonuclease [Frigidibacter sp. MR17.24]|uniref:Rne/Rng family ribonuclease n=1 Tax=Frigidibacter sp. MR17.24 TaxID=3127345 RepID=UPI0030131987
MAKKMLIDATHAEETRVVVADGNKVEEFDFETVNKRQLAGNIYLAKVTRVEPSLQAAFVDYGGNRHGFLAFSEIHPDYYQIPLADRQALLAEERAYAEAMEAEEASRSKRRRRKPRAEAAAGGDATVASDEIDGMDIVDLDEPATEDGAEGGAPEASGDEPYVAADHAAETDEDIESVADEDVTEEIRAPRKPRARRYKIQEVIKVRQIMLVQVVKEERGNKGAALTTYLSLAGRYCVLMPNTARGGGISRKITNAADRKKLKDIASEMEVPEGAGLIIRTAGSQRTPQEIRRDYEYLMRLWQQIRDLTLKSIAPAKIYEEGDLIKRSIRDLFAKDIDEVIVEGERGFLEARDFMKMILPQQVHQVKHYHETLPLFARYQVESYLSGMFNPTVQLKSGGYIVIGVTEALVAIDVNSGRATKEGSIEDTALKTNLEAAEEVARQLRLRDLAGLIVIDFIDMEERKNNAAVEKRLKEKLKTDRARIQVGRISGFGLLEMSRQRLRPGMLEATTQPCAHCHGTGIIRSDESLALSILRAIEEEGTRKRSREVLLKAPMSVVNFLINAKREHVAQIEARYGMSVRIEVDPALISPDYALEKFKVATRAVPEATPVVISGTDAGLMPDEVVVETEEVIVEAVVAEEAVAVEAEPKAEGDERGPKKKRRRRRKRKGTNGEAQGAAGDDEADGDDAEADEGAEDLVAEEPAAEAAPVEAAPVEAALIEAVAEPVAEPVADVVTEAPTEGVAEEPAPKKKRAPRRKKAAEPEAEAAPGEPAPEPVAEEAPKKKRAPRRKKAAEPEAADAPAAEPAVAEAPAAPAAEAAPTPAPTPAPVVEVAAMAEAMAPAAAETAAETADEAEDDKPKRRGWWAR